MSSPLKPVRYRFNSLGDFLIANPLSVNGELDDGWGGRFPVKGREIKASILFCDISGFSKRTLRLNSTETLVFVNNFFTWITAEALRQRPGIVDKYIGDEMMVIFSEEFGSDDDFLDAIQTARWMGENDVLAFCPHIGIARGIVTVGYVGTPLKFDCSVFGAPVTLAARCASVKTARPGIVFPEKDWKDYKFEDAFPPIKRTKPDGSIWLEPPVWEMKPPQTVSMKNLPDLNVIVVEDMTVSLPGQSAEDRAREGLSYLHHVGAYKPRVPYTPVPLDEDSSEFSI